MEHIAAILMLVACEQGNTACRQLPMSTTPFETTQDCKVSLQPALAEATHNFTVVHGKCVEVDPALYIEDATIEWTVTGDTLNVKVRFEDEAVPLIVATNADELSIARN